MKIAILTDSSSDLADQEIVDVFVLGLPVIFPDDSVVADNKTDVVMQEKVLTNISNSLLKTSFINPFILEEKIRELLTTYDYVVFLPIAYNLSGEYENSLILLHNSEFKDRLLIIKHYFTGIQLGKFIAFLAKTVRKKTDITKINFDELVQQWAEQSLLIVIPGSLKNLTTSGRVAKLLTNLFEKRNLKVGIFWSIKPKKIISKNYESLIKKYIKYIKKDFKPDESEIYLAHTKVCNPDLVQLFISELRDWKVKQTNLSTVFAVHGGINTIGLVVFKK